MWIYLVSIIVLLLVLSYEPYRKGIPNGNPNRGDGNGYYVSLITIKNDANAPFYYHTSLELIKRSNISDHLRTYAILNNEQSKEKIDVERFSYGFYPDYSRVYNVSKVLKPFYRFLRPIFPMPGRIRSPDILYEGSEEYNIKPGQVVYRETYPVSEKQWLNLKYRIAYSVIAGSLPFDFPLEEKKTYERPLFYNYFGTQLSDNCSSWVRKILKNINVEISCQSYRFQFMGLNFKVPLSLVDFPYLCSTSSGKPTDKSVSSLATGFSNTTFLR